MFGRFVLHLVGATAVALFPNAAVVVNAQESVDVGPVGLAGSSERTADGWRVSGAGNDIYGHWDEFHYLRFDRTGDVTVTAKVTNFGPTTLESWRKCGIMFRNKNPDVDEQRLAHSTMMLTGWGVAMQSRPDDNGSSRSNHDSYDTSDVWLRLSREGSTVTGYVRRDGEYGWMQFHQEEVHFSGEDLHVGLAVTAHDRQALATMEVTDFEIADGAFSLDVGAAVDVGATGRAVRVQEVREGVYALEAGGADIGGTADSFGFLGGTQTGDVTATFDLASLLRNNNRSKGGLTMRASLDADAAHVSLLVQAGDGVILVSRAAAGEEAVTVPNVGVWRDNVELRLVKTGDAVEASYRGKGAASWYAFGTVSVALGDEYHVGQAVTSADRHQTGRVTGGVVQVTAA